MIVLTEVEKKFCRLAVQIVENDEIITDSGRPDDEVITAENLVAELREVWRGLVEEAPDEYAFLKKRLSQ
jgi:hypothetical protein